MSFPQHSAAIVLSWTRKMRNRVPRGDQCETSQRLIVGRVIDVSVTTTHVQVKTNIMSAQYDARVKDEGSDT